MYRVELEGSRHSGESRNPADYPFMQVPLTPIAFVDHLDFSRSPPSHDRLLPCQGPTSPTLWIPAFAGMTGGLAARSLKGCLHDPSGFLVSPNGSIDLDASKHELPTRRARPRLDFVQRSLLNLRALE